MPQRAAALIASSVESLNAARYCSRARSKSPKNKARSPVSIRTTGSVVGKGVGEGKGVGVGGGPWVLVGATVGRGRETGRGKFWQAEITSIMPSQAIFFVKFMQPYRG